MDLKITQVAPIKLQPPGFKDQVWRVDAAAQPSSRPSPAQPSLGPDLFHLGGVAILSKRRQVTAIRRAHYLENHILCRVMSPTQDRSMGFTDVVLPCT